MTGLENQREFGRGNFSISEQGLRHAISSVILVAITLLASEFFSVYFIYAIVIAVAAALVIAFLVDVHHQKMSLDDDAE